MPRSTKFRIKKGAHGAPSIPPRFNQSFEGVQSSEGVFLASSGIPDAGGSNYMLPFEGLKLTDKGSCTTVETGGELFLSKVKLPQ